MAPKTKTHHVDDDDALLDKIIQENASGRSSQGKDPSSGLSSGIPTPATASMNSSKNSSPTGSLNRKEIQKLAQEGKARRAKEAQEAKAKEAEDAEESVKEEGKGQFHFIVTTIISIFFILLPLAEPVIDWKLVGCLLVSAAVFMYMSWNPAPVAPTTNKKTDEVVVADEAATAGGSMLLSVTCIVWNLALVQLSANWNQLYVVITQIPPMEGSLFAIFNTIAVISGYLWYVRKFPVNKRSEGWDYLLIVLINVNIVSLVALGVIPMSAVYMMFKKIVSLLTNFHV